MATTGDEVKLWKHMRSLEQRYMLPRGSLDGPVRQVLDEQGGDPFEASEVVAMKVSDTRARTAQQFKDLPKGPSYGDVFAAIPSAALARYEQAVGGQMEGVAKAPEAIRDWLKSVTPGPSGPKEALLGPPPKLGEDLLNELLRSGKAYTGQGRERLERTTPKGMGRMQKAVHSGLSSALGSVPALAATIGRGPGAGALVSGMMEGGASFGEAEKLALADRFKHAARDALLEGIPDRLSFGALASAKGPLLANLRSFLLRELPGENISELGQTMNAVISGLRPEVTVGEAIDIVIDTTLATAVGGTAQSLTATGVRKALDSPANPIKRFADPDKLFSTAEETPEKVIQAGEVGMFGPVGRATSAVGRSIKGFVERKAAKGAPAEFSRPDVVPPPPPTVEQDAAALAVEQEQAAPTDQVTTKIGSRYVTVAPDPDPMAIMNAQGFEQREEDTVFGVNIDMMNTSNDVKGVLAEIAEQYRGRIDEQRRGVISQKDTDAISKLYAMDSKKARQLLEGGPGRAYNAEEIRAVKRLTLEAATDAWKKAKTANQTRATADLVVAAQAQGRLVLLQETLAGARAEAGRALGILRRPVTADLAHTPEMAATMQEMMDEMGGRDAFEAVAGAVAKTENLGQAINVMQMTRGQKLAREAWALWYNAMLSGPYTQIRNIGGNSTMMMWTVPEKVAAATLGTIRSGGKRAINLMTGKPGIEYPDRVYLREAPATVVGIAEGLRAGVWAATRTAITGESYFHTTKLDPVSDPFESEPKGLYGLATRWPTRLLATFDELFKVTAYTQKMFELGTRDGIRSGKSGVDLVKHVIDYRAYPKESGLKEATHYAHVQTFTDPMGPITKQIASIKNDIPPMRLLVPFLRTPTKIVNAAVNKTPFGIFTIDKELQPGAKASYGLKKGLKEGGASRDEILGRIAFGTSAMGYIAYLAAQGLVNGGGPSDPERRKLWRLNNQPYSIKKSLIQPDTPPEDDEWLAVDWMEPLGMLIGLSADIADLIAVASDEEADELIGRATFSLAHNLTNKTMMQGVHELFSAMHDPGRYGTPLLKQLSGTLVPTLSNTIAKKMDPVLRSTKATGDEGGLLVEGAGAAEELVGIEQGPLYRTQQLTSQLMSRTPNHSKKLLPIIDVRGDPIILDPGWAPDMLGKWGEFASPIWKHPADRDPVAQALYDAGWQPKRGSRTLHGVELSERQKTDLYAGGQKAGFRTLDSLWKNGGLHRIGVAKYNPEVMVAPGFKNLSKFQIQELANSVFDEGWDEARERLPELYPELIEKITARKEKRKGLIDLRAGE